MIRWIFFDVGNVLFNDDPQTYLIHRRYHQAAARVKTDFTFAQFLVEREAEVRRGNRWPTRHVLLRHISPDEFAAVFEQVTDELRGIYDAVNLPMPGVLPLVRKLADQYQLGVIANQVTECRASLARRGLLDYFDVVAISEELDLHKPDPALYRWSLEQAGVSPDEAVMVGDRHDNDVVPAAELGLFTVWLRWQTTRGKGWDPDDPLAREFLASHEREPFYGRVTRDDVRPSATVADLPSVPSAIEQLGALGDGA